MAIFQKFERPRSHSKALDELIGRAYLDTQLTHQQKAVLICLAWHAKNRAGQAYPSQTTVSQLTGVCISLVGRAIKHLAERGYIEKIDRHRTDGGRTSSMIVIHGMQYFPEDHQSVQAAQSPENQRHKTERLSLQHTGAHRTAYAPLKQESLKQDSSPAAFADLSVPHTTATVQRANDFSQDLKVTQLQADQRVEATLVSAKRQAPVLAALMGYLTSNRQSLRDVDYLAICRFETDSTYRDIRSILTQRTPREHARQYIETFFAKREPKMTKPSKSALDQMEAELSQYPQLILATAFSRLDAIYKPNYAIPPTIKQVLATVEDQVRLAAIYRNSMVAFDDAKRLFEAQQKKRGLPLPQIPCLRSDGQTTSIAPTALA